MLHSKNRSNLKHKWKNSFVCCCRLETVWHIIISVCFLVRVVFFSSGGGIYAFHFLKNDDHPCVSVSSAVMKEQPLRFECAAVQIMAGSRTCILPWAASAFYTFIIHIEPKDVQVLLYVSISFL